MRYSAWFYGGLERNCGLTDGDFELHDGANGRNRFLKGEFKPSMDAIPTGQKIYLNGWAKISNDVTVLLVCIPAVDSPASLKNPNFVADPTSEVKYAIVDPQFRWDDKIQTTTLWEFNRMIRHWHKGHEFGPVPKSCTCCKWTEGELRQVMLRVKRAA